MGYWSHIALEGHCLAQDEEAPCGRISPSGFCMGTKMCPHFGYVSVSLKEATRYVPIRLIILEKLSMLLESTREWIDYAFDKIVLFFSKKKDEDDYAGLRKFRRVDDDTQELLDKQYQKEALSFDKWLKQRNKDWEE